MRLAKSIERDTEKYLQTLGTTDLSPDTLRKIFEQVKKIVNSSVAGSGLKFSQETLTWLSGIIFRTIRVGDNQLIDDYVFFNEIPIEELPADEVKSVKNLFAENDMITAYLEGT